MFEDNVSLLSNSKNKDEIVFVLNAILSDIDRLKNRKDFYDFIEFINKSSNDFINEIKSILNTLNFNNEIVLLEKIYLSLENTIFLRDQFFIQSFFDYGKFEYYRDCIEKITFYIKEKKIWCHFEFFEKLISSEDIFRKSFIDLKINYLNYVEAQQSQFDYSTFLLQNIKKACTLNNISEESFLEFLEGKFRKSLPKRFVYLFNQFRKNRISKNDFVELMILSPEDMIQYFSKNLSEKTKLKIKVLRPEEIEKSKKAYKYFIKNKIEDNISLSKREYKVEESERVLINRLKKGDDIFNTFRKDLLIGFMTVSFYELAINYIDSFSMNEENLYLKLEVLLKRCEYARFIEAYNLNENIHKDKIEFNYLRGIVYYELGDKKKSEVIFKEILIEDPEYRNVREYLNEEK